jgi:hypothetical protein
MAVRLSALRTGCTLLARNIIYMLLVLISLRVYDGLGKFKKIIHLI